MIFKENTHLLLENKSIKKTACKVRCLPLLVSISGLTYCAVPTKLDLLFTVISSSTLSTLMRLLLKIAILGINLGSNQARYESGHGIRFGLKQFA